MSLISTKLLIIFVNFIIASFCPFQVCFAWSNWNNINRKKKFATFGNTNKIAEKNSQITKKNFFLQPWMRWKLGDYEGLKQDCVQYHYASSSITLPGKDCNTNDCLYDESALEGFQVANSLFQHFLRGSSSYRDGNEVRGNVKWIWLPALTRPGLQETKKLIHMLNNEIPSSLLGIHNNVTLLDWPDVPAPCIKWSYSEIITTNKIFQHSNNTPSNPSNKVEDDYSEVFNTEKWVNNTLGRLRLCPFTASTSRGAIGLESVDVTEGPVAIRSVTVPKATTGTKAGMVLAARGVMAEFWKGVHDLAKIPESQISTFLLTCKEYDDHFDSFVKLCDHIIEPSVQAVKGNDIIGKAWFHPLYNTASVYNNGIDSQPYSSSTILPGHALQVPLIETFLKQYYPTYDKRNGVDYDNKERLSNYNVTPANIALANDRIRHSPHATVNILRRSQLNAAKDLEKSTKNSRPNFIYARNIIKILTETV